MPHRLSLEIHEKCHGQEPLICVQSNVSRFETQALGAFGVLKLVDAPKVHHQPVSLKLNKIQAFSDSPSQPINLLGTAA
jgi:hypothetical protein